MLPPLTPINEADLIKLDGLRLERLRVCFKALETAALYISGERFGEEGFFPKLSRLDRTLIISGGINVALLDHELKELKTQAWLIAACTSIKVYCCNQLIFDHHGLWHKLGEKASGDPGMATAIQEQQDWKIDNGTQVLEPTPTPKRIMRSLSLADIAADLEAEPSALQTFLEEQNATLIEFGGTIIVPEKEAMSVYEHYSLVRARQKMEERFASLNAPVVIEKPRQTTAPKEPKPKKNYLTWKGEFKVVKSSYKKTLQNALNALFPNAPDDQMLALADITSDSEMGKAYIDKIVRDPAYTDKARARENLLKASSELAAESNNQSSGEEQKEEAVA